jgi:hypothetical protein
MWIGIAVSIFIALAVAFLIFVFIRKDTRRKAANKEMRSLNGISAGISSQLHDVLPGSKWRWVCCPHGFAANGGIARIDIAAPSGDKRFMDVCYSPRGYMALHVVNVCELAELVTDSPAGNPIEIPDTPVETVVAQKTVDGESIGKWFNIVLLNPLNDLIGDLNAKDEVCIHISRDGKAFLEENGGNTVVYDFGEMPDISLWGQVIEKLNEKGLYAEIQDHNCLFISWA